MDSCAEQKKQEFCQAVLDAANRPGQLPHLIHCRLTQLTPDGNATGELEIHPDVLNPWNTVHGGALPPWRTILQAREYWRLPGASA